MSVYRQSLGAFMDGYREGRSAPQSLPDVDFRKFIDLTVAKSKEVADNVLESRGMKPAPRDPNVPPQGDELEQDLKKLMKYTVEQGKTVATNVMDPANIDKIKDLTEDDVKQAVKHTVQKGKDTIQQGKDAAQVMQDILHESTKSSNNGTSTTTTTPSPVDKSSS